VYEIQCFLRSFCYVPLMKVQFPTNVKNITTSLLMPYVRNY